MANLRSSPFPGHTSAASDFPPLAPSCLRYRLFITCIILNITFNGGSRLIPSVWLSIIAAANTRVAPR